MTKSLVYFVFLSVFACRCDRCNRRNRDAAAVGRSLVAMYTLYNEKIILKTHADKILLFATILNQIDPVLVQEDHIGGGVVVPCKRQKTHEEAEYSFCMYPKMLPHLCFLRSTETRSLLVRLRVSFP